MRSHGGVVSRAALLVLLLGAAPFAFTSRGGVRTNDALCEPELCCPETHSWCVLNGLDFPNYYYKHNGGICWSQT
jgi:hypothetical protein